MRVISGTARGRRLFSPPDNGVRPTLDRIKEAAFNILQFQLPDAIFLDMFAGSGQIGIEALSRGADRALFFEPDKAAYALLQKNLHHTGLAGSARTYPASYTALARLSPPPRVDIAYIDPPFGENLYARALAFLIEGGLVHEGATVVCEAPVRTELPERVGGFTRRSRRYGQVELHIYTCPKESADEFAQYRTPDGSGPKTQAEKTEEGL